MNVSSTKHPYAGRFRHAAPVAATAPAATEPQKAGFVLFLLVNAILFIRPAEIIPALEALPLYEGCIIGALLFSLPAVLAQLSPESLARAPVTCCVIGYFVAIILSNVAHGDLFMARLTATNFAKVVLYYLLLVGLVQSPARLRTLLVTVLVLVSVVGFLALLRYHGILDVLKLEAYVDNRGEEDELGQRTTFLRLMATGIFSDPNDFSLVLVTAILIALKFMLDQKGLLPRLLVAAPAAMLMYALVRTYSRGGFLALLAGIATLLVGRYGVKKAVPLMILVLPAIALAVGGRQINIDFSDDEDTAAGRVEIWYNGLQEFQAAPLFGIGAGQMYDVIGIVAHNSIVHSYIETGLLGGTLFLGMFYIPVTVLWGLRNPAAQARMDPNLRQWRPYLLAVTVAFVVGLCSLSRTYVVSTYLVVGLAAAFLNLLRIQNPSSVPSVNVALVQRLAIVSVAMLAFTYVFIRIVL